MKNITVKYTGIVQKYSYGHILSVKKSIYNVLYRKKTENYRITEKKYVMPNGMFCLKNTDIQTRIKML